MSRDVLIFYVIVTSVCNSRFYFNSLSNFNLFKAYWSPDAPTVYHSTTVRSAHTVFMRFVFI